MFSIPNPCPKKWNEMTPVEGGNFCNACEKIVVDFSECSNEQILEYFRSLNGQRVCGKLRPSQLVQRERKYQLAKFAAALFLVFSFGLFSSCKNEPEQHVVGDVVNNNLPPAPDTLNDSTFKANQIKPEAPFRLSPGDSTRVADSVERTKNHVRDFE